MKRFFFLGLMALLAVPTYAQPDTEDPGVYSDYMVDQQQGVARAMISLNKATVSSDDPNVFNTKRMEVVTALDLAIKNISAMAPFGGRSDYRDEMLNLLTRQKEIFVGGYVELAQLLAAKDASLADLKAYYVHQDKLGKEIKKLTSEAKVQQKKFAKDHGVGLTENELGDQMKQINEVNDYSSRLYMHYLDLAVKNEVFMNALAANDLAGMRKARADILKTCNPIVAKVSSTQAYNGYSGFQKATLKLVELYANSAKKEYQELIEITELMEKEPTTNEEVDKYNAGVERYNEITQMINENSTNLMNEFNATNTELLKRNMPQ